MAIVAAIGLTVALSGQTLDSEARIYEEDGRLEIDFIQDSDYAYDCADLFFGTRIEVPMKTGRCG